MDSLTVDPLDKVIPRLHGCEGWLCGRHSVGETQCTGCVNARCWIMYFEAMGKAKLDRKLEIRKVCLSSA